jgi:hypothetical protein
MIETNSEQMVEALGTLNNRHSDVQSPTRELPNANVNNPWTHDYSVRECGCDFSVIAI